MEMQQTKQPIWVQIGAIGIQSRKTALSYMWFSVAGAVAAILYGLQDPRWYVGASLFFAAYWYWEIAKWMLKQDQVALQTDK